MRVLVTRPEEDARETEALLKIRGHDAVVAPLLEVNFRDGPQIELAGIQAILATSANGVRALSRRTARRDLPLFAVGPQSAEAARNSGFTSVRSGDGDAAGLAKAIPTWVSAESGPLFHAAGMEGESQLALTLNALGFAVRTEHLYEVRAVADLPAVARDALASGLLDAVLLFSPRSARVFAGCVERADLAGAASRLIAICISPATAAALAALPMCEVRVAKRPNQPSLLDRLG